MSIFDRWQSWVSTVTRREEAMPEAAPPKPPNARPADDEDQLIARTTVESVERENTRRAEDLRPAERRSPERLAAQLKPFGYSNSKWESLKAAMQPGDELWTFASSPASWRALAGRAGVALVRDGKIVATVVTMVN